LIQAVVLQNVRHLIESNNAIIVALSNSVCALFPVPLGAQVFPIPVCKFIDLLSLSYL
jgi:hypothetical protein